MSTIPGHDAWRDAGLERPESTDLPDGIDPPVGAGSSGSDDLSTDGYVPADPRPDLDGLADPADVAEQRAEVPDEEGDDYRG